MGINFYCLVQNNTLNSNEALQKGIAEEWFTELKG